MNRCSYENPLSTRYASESMVQLWSDQRKFSTWRRLWVALAQSQCELGLNVSEKQIEAMRVGVDSIDFDKADEYERQLRHDVMAHVHAYGDQCPEARGIIHLGATSCFVTDNTDLILLRDGLTQIIDLLVSCIELLAQFAEKYQALSCLGFTHLQPAQPTTVGKRATLWCYDLIQDLEDLEYRLSKLCFRGVKGTTGTQASFLKLFNGDHAKVVELDRLVAKKMGFEKTYPVTGQTYSRKVDVHILSALSGIGQTAHKFATDLRLLQHWHEIEEPFGANQVGSSAMAYKRNPMRAERVCALSRFLLNLTGNSEQTIATQWMERTLDDSANRRITIPQAFLGADAILGICGNLAGGMVVYPKVIEKNLNRELPFLATENILMAGVAAGGDRQSLHECIRKHSHAAAQRLKEGGAQENDLIDRLSNDPEFAGVDFETLLDSRQFTGRASEQVSDFLEEVMKPIRHRYHDFIANQGLSVREIEV